MRACGGTGDTCACVLCVHYSTSNHGSAIDTFRQVIEVAIRTENRIYPRLIESLSIIEQQVCPCSRITILNRSSKHEKDVHVGDKPPNGVYETSLPLLPSPCCACLSVPTCAALSLPVPVYLCPCLHACAPVLRRAFPLQPCLHCAQAHIFHLGVAWLWYATSVFHSDFLWLQSNCVKMQPDLACVRIQSFCDTNHLTRFVRCMDIDPVPACMGTDLLAAPPPRVLRQCAALFDLVIHAMTPTMTPNLP